MSPAGVPTHPLPEARHTADKREAAESFLRFARGEGLPEWPLELFLEVSNVCDLRCAMCFRFSGLNPHRGALIRAEARGFMELAPVLEAVAELLPRALVVNVFGYGEPTLHPAFAQLVETLAASEALVEFFTSGMHLDDPLAALLVEHGVHRVTVSFSGSTREEYESVYLGGDFERVLDGLTRLRQHKRLAGSSYPLLEVNSLAFRHHVRTLDRFVTLMAEHGADQVNLTPLHEHVEAVDPLRGHAAPLGSLAGATVMTRAEAAAAALGVRLRIHPGLISPPTGRPQPRRGPVAAPPPAPEEPDTPLSSFPELARRLSPATNPTPLPPAAAPVDAVAEPLEEVRARLRVTSLQGLADQGADFVCLEPFKSLYVRRNGEVKACCYMVDEAPALGHVARASGRRIWGGSGFETVRHGVLNGEYPLASCTYCLLTQEAPPSHGFEVRLRDYLRWHGERFAPGPELAALEVVAGELARLGDGRAIADRMASRRSPCLARPDLLEAARRLLASAGAGHHPDPDLLEGYLDSGAGASGWVWSPRHPELRFPVACPTAGRDGGERLADAFRADLPAAGKGDGRYAFSFPLPSPARARPEVRLGDSDWVVTGAGICRRPQGKPGE